MKIGWKKNNHGKGHLGKPAWNRGKPAPWVNWKILFKPEIRKIALEKAMISNIGRPSPLRGKNCDWSKGEKNVNWKGGISSKNRKIRRLYIWKEWREKVFKRDDYTCQICGERGKELHPNHIKKFADFPDIRFVTNNGITLCSICHTTLINQHEEEWQSYFNFNLQVRNIFYV